MAVVITSAVRTPIGRLNGVFAGTPADKLGTAVIREALKRSEARGEEVTEVILGQVLNAGQGQNPARQAAIHSGLPESVPAWGLNQMCGSGLKAVVLGMQTVESKGGLVVAGGQESMSQAPHAMHLRQGKKMGNATMVDTMLHDGLIDAFHEYHMGVTAENLKKEKGISREQQDAFAFRSQQKCKEAMEAGRFDAEITPVVLKDHKGKENPVTEDEAPRPEVTREKLASLPAAFEESGTVTAGNASGIDDGASAVVLMSEKNAQSRGIEPLGRIVSWAQAGVGPSVMGSGPIPATRAALKEAGWTSDDLDLIELNEAFAAQSLYVIDEMGWDEEIINVNGGAIALGHPIGASGARILTTLLHEMQRRDVKKGLATLCIGGGMGIAMCIECD